MAGEKKTPGIKLVGGAGDRMVFSREDWDAFILATHRMGRTTVVGAGWALGYERPSGVPGLQTLAWQGVNCYPIDEVDRELLRPYGAGLHDDSLQTRPDGLHLPAA